MEKVDQEKEVDAIFLEFSKFNKVDHTKPSIGCRAS